MRIVEPSSQRAFWITPGGGCETSESDAAALARELYEETGLTQFNESHLIWTRSIEFVWENKTYKQDERFYWINVPSYEPHPVALVSEVESASFDSLRWWSVEEIANSRETFAPNDLADRIIELRKHGVPEQPIALGI